MIDVASWLRLGGSAFGFLRHLFAWLPRGRKPLIFIEQGGTWSYLEQPAGGVIQLQALLHVTNERERESIIVTRVRLRRAGLPYFFRASEWQDCSRAEIGGQVFLPMLVGPALPRRATSVVSILHGHRADRPHTTKPIKFLLEIWDQRGSRHRTTLRLRP